jgi:hypothetical protein
MASQNSPSLLAEGGQPPGGELRVAGGFGDLDGDVKFHEQLSELGGPGLAGELGDPGELADVVGIVENSP